MLQPPLRLAALTRPSVARLCMWFGLFALAATTLAACGDDPASPEDAAGSLAGFVDLSEDLTQLNEAGDMVGFDDLLRTGTDLTVFAPTDMGFAQLGPNLVARLNDSRNQDILSKILRRHVVPRRVLASDLRDGATLETLEGTPLTVTIDGEGEVAVEGMPVTRTDVLVPNGVLHQMDGLARDHLTLEERLRITPLIATFADALEDVGLQSLVATGEPYTLFIPLNGAFSNLDETFEALLRTSNLDVLRKTLRHHIVPGSLRVQDLQDGDVLTALDGSSLTVSKGGGLTYVDGARIVIPDVATSDGTIHMLDQVVLDHLTITERIRVTPSLFTSFTLFRDAGVLDEFTEDGAFTLFAPSERSIQNLGPEFRAQLRQRPDLLERTMQYHASPVAADAERVQTGEALPGFGGYTLPLTVGEGDVFLGPRSRVQFPPLKASNGYLYTVNALNPPPDVNLEERAIFLRLFRFLNALAQYDLLGALQSEAPLTVFAPTDQAFQFGSIPGDDPAETLRYHLVPGRYALEDLGPTQTLETLLADSLLLVEVRNGTQMLADSIPVARRDAFATNGVIHQMGLTFLDPCAFWERPEPGEPCEF